VYDSIRFQKARSRSPDVLSDLLLHETFSEELQRRYLDSRFRYIPPAFLVGLGGHLTSGLWAGASSIYICPLASGQIRSVPFMQFVAVVLDCYLVIAVYELCLQRSIQGERVGSKSPNVVGTVMLVRANQKFPSLLLLTAFLDSFSPLASCWFCPFYCKARVSRFNALPVDALRSPSSLCVRVARGIIYRALCLLNILCKLVISLRLAFADLIDDSLWSP
jgi:hypothetical protein